MNRHIIQRLLKKIEWLFGGGTAKYRVKGLCVEMKGGGTGPFWGFAHLTDFETTEQAEIFAKKWAKEAGGVYCGQSMSGENYMSKDKFIVELSTYSLEKGKIGEAFAEPVVRREHDNPISAMIDLDQAIDSEECNVLGRGRYSRIICPNEGVVSLNYMYQKTFGEIPVDTPKGYKYPCLKKAKKTNIIHNEV